MSDAREKVFLVIDPGLKHCGVGIVRKTPNLAPDAPLTVELLWSTVGDLSGRVNPDKEKARDLAYTIHREAEARGVTDVLIEFQPPLRTCANPALVRWNSWIEGFFVGYFTGEYPISYVHSCALKRKLKITTMGAHHLNKQMSLISARNYVSTEIRTDHEADCVLMAVYQLVTGR
jgi:hypothetical protein